VAVDRETQLLVQRVRDLRVRHRAEQTAVAARLRGDADHGLFELRGDVLRVRDLFGLLPLLGALLLLELFHRARRRDDGELLREQEVVGVAVLDVHDRAARAERLDVAGENDLHCAAPTGRRTGAGR
jgi:hypothetical protein